MEPETGDQRAADLAGARRVLRDAYDQARAGGYQPGSGAMRALAQAEQGYQQARRRYQVAMGAAHAAH